MEQLTIVPVPHEFWGTQEGSHSKLVHGSRVVSVVLSYHVLKAGDLLHNCFPGPPFIRSFKPAMRSILIGLVSLSR